MVNSSSLCARCDYSLCFNLFLLPARLLTHSLLLASPRNFSKFSFQTTTNCCCCCCRCHADLWLLGLQIKLREATSLLLMLAFSPPWRVATVVARHNSSDGKSSNCLWDWLCNDLEKLKIGWMSHSSSSSPYKTVCCVPFKQLAGEDCCEQAIRASASKLFPGTLAMLACQAHASDCL